MAIQELDTVETSAVAGGGSSGMSVNNCIGLFTLGGAAVGAYAGGLAGAGLGIGLGGALGLILCDSLVH